MVGSALSCGLRSDPALGRAALAWHEALEGVAVCSRCVARSGLRGLRRSLPLFSPNRALCLHSPYAGTLAPLDRGAEESYLAVFQEEADKDPVHTDLLTMLLLVVFFGLSFGWLLTNSQKERALCSLGVVGPSLASACEDLPFPGVLRL
jgi:hypothetical protein